MATREDLKTIPYSLYLPEDLRLALNEVGGTAIPVPNKQELEDAFGGLVIAGKNTIDYGQGRNQNFVNLLANFASQEGGTPGFPDPLLIPNPLLGQTWYDLTAATLKIYDGASWIASTSSIAASSVVVSPTVAGLNNVQDVLESFELDITTLISDFTAHIVDTTDAHDASAISFVAYGSVGSTNVQGAIQELEDEIDVVQTDIANHLADPTDAHDASAISTSPFINGTFNVQTGLESLDAVDDAQGILISANTSLINGHINDNVDAHAASAISITSIPQIPIAFDVQVALQELADAITVSGVASFQSGAFPATSKVIRTVNLPAAFSVAGADLYQLVLINLTAEWGYTPGDYVLLQEQGNQRDEGSGPAQESSGIWFDPVASPLVVRFLINYNKSSDIWINRNDAFALFGDNGVPATAAFWEVRLRAFRF